MEVFCIIFLPLLKSPDEKDYDFDDNPSFNDEGQRDIETKIRSMFRQDILTFRHERITDRKLVVYAMTQSSKVFNFLKLKHSISRVHE